MHASASRLAFIVKRIKFEELLGLAYLAAVARRDGHEVQLFESTRHGFARDLAAYQPALIGYSVTSGSEPYYLRLNRELKDCRHFLSLWGGPHPTFDPGFIAHEGVDALCRGEGESLLAGLLDALRAGRELSPLPGLSYKDTGGRVVHCPVGRPEPDLDRLPFPDRELFYRAAPGLLRQRMLRVMTARGCPFSCTYCFNAGWRELYRLPAAASVRRRSVPGVIAEINAARTRHPIACVQFIDDTFNLDPAWLREFTPAYASQVGLPFQCNVRPDLLDDEVAALLRRAGCAFVSTGVEAASDHIRNGLFRRNISDTQLHRGLGLLARQGLKVKTENILGAPGSAFSDDWQTLLLNQQLAPAAATASIFQPYPGTPLAAPGSRAGGGAVSGDNYFHAVSQPATPAQRRRLLHLQSLFGLLVRYPLLAAVMRPLLNLPATRWLRLFGALADVVMLGRLLPIRYSLRDRVFLAGRFLHRYYR